MVVMVGEAMVVGALGVVVTEREAVAVAREAVAWVGAEKGWGTVEALAEERVLAMVVEAEAAVAWEVAA